MFFLLIVLCQINIRVKTDSVPCEIWVSQSGILSKIIFLFKNKKDQNADQTKCTGESSPSLSHRPTGLVFFLSCYNDSANFLSGAVPPLISIWETGAEITRSSACSHTLTSGSESKWETLLKPPEYQTNSKWKPRPASEFRPRPFMLWDNRADRWNTMSPVSFVKSFYEASLWNNGPIRVRDGDELEDVRWHHKWLVWWFLCSWCQKAEMAARGKASFTYFCVPDRLLLYVWITEQL